MSRAFWTRANAVFCRSRQGLTNVASRERMRPQRCGWVLFWLAVLAVTAPAQSASPRIIDCHVHHNGDPAFLQKLLAKLDSVDGMAFLLVSPADLKSTKPFVDEHSNRLIGFGSIDPDDAHALEQIDQFRSAGFRGLGELENPRKD